MDPQPTLVRLSEVRSACAEVCERARFVHIDAEALAAYAGALPLSEVRAQTNVDPPKDLADLESAVAFVVTLNAVNFGSGWFPHLTKLEGKSGFRTIEAHLRNHFESAGSLSVDTLRGMDVARAAELFGQQRTPPIDALCGLFARALADLGALISEKYAGSFVALVERAEGRAELLVQALCEMALYRDIATYDELCVPFLKRAQITVADLHAQWPEGIGAFRDVDQLTMFADNLVPHVLRLDGVLKVDPDLVARIEREELLEAGSAEEVELRAAAVTAVEALVTHLAARGEVLTPAQLDFWLWSRGARPRYKSRPRHRARSHYY